MLKSKFLRGVFIHQAIRTPIAKFGGGFAKVSAPRLAADLLKEGVKRQQREPDRVIMGHARQAGAGPNPARQATCFSGLSDSIPAWTINQACASGMAAISQACDQIALGRAEHIWAGGVEAMSQTPYLLPQTRWGQKLGNQPLLDGMYQDGFHCPMADMVMGATVEQLAKEQGISRAEQDAFALHSQQKTQEALERGFFDTEIIPIHNGKELIQKDEHPRSGSTLEGLQKLKPVFDLESGSITAGNSSGITDGAVWLELSTDPSNAIAEIIDYQTTALDPMYMGLGPVSATTELLKRNSLKIEDIDFVELNEAFAAQVIACQRHLKFPEDKVNVHGGAIALGHPIGATGARILSTLAHTLNAKSGELGIATLCVSGGMGFSVLIRTSI